jgi:4'-phosphopantetheinyl transferase
VTWQTISRPGCATLLLSGFDLDSPPEKSWAPAEALSREEIERAARFRRARDARRFLAGRMRTRSALAELLGIAPERIAFAAGPFGRPEIRYPATSLSFSLAHAGGRAVLAVAEGGRVGVDIEPRDAAPDAEALASRALAPRELEELFARPSSERESFFLSRWTAKEALLKAAGIGFACDPARITLQRDAQGGFGARGEPRIAGLTAWHVEEAPGFLVALAADTRPGSSAADRTELQD